MRPIELTLSKLEGVKPSGDGYVAHCPAHDDRSPSLSVREGEDGRVLLKCHAGCKLEDITSQLGISVSDLFLKCVNVNKKPIDRSRKQNIVDNGPSFDTSDQAIAYLSDNKGEPTAIYPYQDVAGNSIAYQLRWDYPDGSKQFLPISLRSNQWVIKAPASPRPLFSAPEILVADCIYIVEGEKAAAQMQAIGFTATTSLNGARGASKTDWSILAGKDVVICPDNDPSGEEYCEEVIQQLSRLRPAPTIKVVRFDGLPEKGDIVEFVEQQDGDLEAARLAVITASKEAEIVSTNKLDAPSGLFHPFPIEELPEPARSYVQTASNAIGCDPTYIVLPLLTVCGAMLGNRFRVRVKDGWLEPPVIWTAMVGESGSMKTPALFAVIEPVYALQTSMNANYQEAHRAYKVDHQNYLQEYAKFKKTGKGTPPECPTEPLLKQLIVSDATMEALAMILTRNPNGVLLVRDELGGWISSFDRYAQGKGGGDVSHWLSTFGAKPLTMDRKTGPTPQVHVPEAAVCITGSIQPGTLHYALGQQHRNNGLLARFLPASPPRQIKQWREEGITPHDQAMLADLVGRLLEFVPEECVAGHEPFEMPLDPGAKTIWCAFFDQHAQEQVMLTGDLAAAWSKLECYVPRLALIFWAIRSVSGEQGQENTSAIDQGSMQSAINVIQWFKHETQRVYSLLDESESERDQRRLIEFIQSKGDRISASELTRSYRPCRGRGKAKEALDQLVANGYGYWEQPPQKGPGRPPALELVLGSVN